MDGSFMEDLWKGVMIWIAIIAVGAFLLGLSVAGLIMWLT